MCWLSIIAFVFIGCSGAVRTESYEDRIRDFSTSWNQLFGWLNFSSIDDFEDSYRGAYFHSRILVVLTVNFN